MPPKELATIQISERADTSADITVRQGRSCPGVIIIRDKHVPTEKGIAQAEPVGRHELRVDWIAFLCESRANLNPTSEKSRSKR